MHVHLDPLGRYPTKSCQPLTQFCVVDDVGDTRRRKANYFIPMEFAKPVQIGPRPQQTHIVNAGKSGAM